MLEQEMSTLRQGSLSVAEYYDQVQLKLTALTNKTIMSYEPDFAFQLNEKFRKDALRVFISGVKKSISDTLFSSRPEDLPAALASAEELEGHTMRYQFAASFSGDHKETKDYHVRKPHEATSHQPTNQVPQINPFKNVAQSPIPYKPQGSQVQRRFPPAEPMDVDPSLRTRRFNDDRRQNINNLEVEVDDLAYEQAIRQSLREEEENEDDNVHFLEKGPCYRL